MRYLPLATLFLLLVFGCSSSPGSSGPRGAQHAELLVLYPGLVYKSTQEARVEGEGTSWAYTTTDPAKKVVHFYLQKWEGATGGEEMDGLSIVRFEIPKSKDILSVMVSTEGSKTTVVLNETLVPESASKADRR